MTMAYQAHELPLVLVECCTRYLVSAMHWCPPCRRCEEIPQYIGDTVWWLEFQDAG
jgi:hypothetical protein